MIHHLHNKRRGFTLIELVAVILVLGILTAIAVSRFATIESEARRGTLRGLEAAIHSAVLLSRVKYRLANAGTTEIDMDGTTVAVNSNGLPCASAAGIGSALYTNNGFVISSDPSNSCNGSQNITFWPETKTNNSQCRLVYRETGVIDIYTNNC